MKTSVQVFADSTNYAIIKKLLTNVRFSCAPSLTGVQYYTKSEGFHGQPYRTND